MQRGVVPLDGGFDVGFVEGLIGDVLVVVCTRPAQPFLCSDLWLA